MANQNYGLFAVISGTVVLQAGSSEADQDEFVKSARESKGFEVAITFDRFTNKVVKMEAHKELKYKLAERAKRKVSVRQTRVEEEPEAPPVKGWSL